MTGGQSSRVPRRGWPGSTLMIMAARCRGCKGCGWPAYGRPTIGDVTEALVRESHGLGLKIVPWTVNDKADQAAADRQVGRHHHRPSRIRPRA